MAKKKVNKATAAVKETKKTPAPVKKAKETLNRRELVDNIALKTGLTKKAANDAVNAIIETMSEAFVEGKNVSFVGFGTFHTVDKPERTANVLGKKTTIAAHTAVKFKAGSILKSKLVK